MTQIEAARDNKITRKMEAVARAEGQHPALIRDRVLNGTVVIPSNIERDITNLCGIGTGLRTKVNANIGSSLGCEDIKSEIDKLACAIEFGSDTVMDLSTGKNLKKIRKLILEKSPVPVGTVPIYEIASKKMASKKEIGSITVDEILSCIEEQAREGVDFFTIHCGVTKNALKQLRNSNRLLDIVSRGGALISTWIVQTNKENPFYEYFDEIVRIAKKYDITLSLGDGMRPGCLNDATDRAQITELVTLGELARKARKESVQVMIEGPGHIPINQISRNVEMEKSLCDNAPFYVLGPIVTDIAPGYDHITSAIGGAIAASCGADFLCYVTPSEHLRLPTLDDVKEGVIATKIAAHAADIAKGIKGSQELDNAISRERKKRNWVKQIELSIDPKKAKQYRRSSESAPKNVCTMCDEYCPIKIYDDSTKKKDDVYHAIKEGL
ncbi:MAG: phosphomethylpyrimidine synthase ThiC [Candidatus Omnitrophica bacterium]|nr:phosphomethylpyrimidine synthase ThiC [Candidatus Omnitrophota bacterium]